MRNGLLFKINLYICRGLVKNPIKEIKQPQMVCELDPPRLKGFLILWHTYTDTLD
jgi:hypothetical protein